MRPLLAAPATPERVGAALDGTGPALLPTTRPAVLQTLRPEDGVDDDVAVVAWCEDAAVGVDVDGPGREGWVQHEARGKCAGSGITAPPPEHLVARSLTTPPGCVAAVAVDTDGPWEVVVR